MHFSFLMVHNDVNQQDYGCTLQLCGNSVHNDALYLCTDGTNVPIRTSRHDHIFTSLHLPVKCLTSYIVSKSALLKPTSKGP